MFKIFFFITKLYIIKIKNLSNLKLKKSTKMKLLHLKKV